MLMEAMLALCMLAMMLSGLFLVMDKMSNKNVYIASDEEATSVVSSVLDNSPTVYLLSPVSSFTYR